MSFGSQFFFHISASVHQEKLGQASRLPFAIINMRVNYRKDSSSPSPNAVRLQYNEFGHHRAVVVFFLIQHSIVLTNSFMHYTDYSHIHHHSGIQVTIALLLLLQEMISFFSDFPLGNKKWIVDFGVHWRKNAEPSLLDFTKKEVFSFNYSYFSAFKHLDIFYVVLQ